MHIQIKKRRFALINTVVTMFKKETSIQAILYILDKLEGGRTDMHKICKILYFADQRHLSLYGRTITRDDYIKMPYGPVPSKIYDIFKALCGESYFSDHIADIAEYLEIVNKIMLRAKQKCNTDYLSDSDIECLDYAVAKCKDLSFADLTNISHDFAWNNTQDGRKISPKDMLREVGDTEEYINFVTTKPIFSFAH